MDTEKKDYTAPALEVIEFETEDVIRTSTPGTGSSGGIYELPRVGGTASFY